MNPDTVLLDWWEEAVAAGAHPRLTRVDGSWYVAFGGDLGCLRSTPYRTVREALAGAMNAFRGD